MPDTSDFCAHAALASRFLLEWSVDIRKHIAISKIRKLCVLFTTVFLQRSLRTRDLWGLVIEWWVCWWFCSDNQPSLQLPPRICSSPQSPCYSDLCCAELQWHRYYPCWGLPLPAPHAPEFGQEYSNTMPDFLVYLVSNMFFQLQHSGGFSVTSLCCCEAELLNAGSSLAFDAESFRTGWLHGCHLLATLGNSQLLCKTSSF